MATLEELRNSLPEFARDIKLNLQTVPSSTSLSPAQRWGVAVASAAAARNPELLAAVVTEARREADSAVVEDALAAAALMGMNNVYYRFRHVIGKPSYSEKPARLRMQRLVKPATNKTDFELFSMVASAINGCEACVRAHEQVVLEGGLTEDQVHDAIRIASTFNAAAVSLEMAALSVPVAVPS
jgi:alkyl hydroperoxide reductase subunit D